MAEIGQDSTCGKCGPGQTDEPWFCCKWELKDETGGPRHLLNGKAWAVGCQGDVKAESDSRRPENEVSQSLLPPTARTQAVWPGHSLWADKAPRGFPLPTREPALPGSHSKGSSWNCFHLNAICKGPVHVPSAAPAGGSKRWTSWEGAHTPHTWDTWTGRAEEKAYHCPSTQRIQMGKSGLYPILESVEFWFKKIKTPL